MDARRLALAGVVVLLGAGVGVGWMSLPQPPDPVSAPSAPEAVVPGNSRGADAARLKRPPPASKPAGAARDDATPERADPDRVDPAVRAVLAHAEQAVPLFRRSARILQHAEPPVYGDIAGQLADRLASVGPDTPLGERQELIHEERQLIEHLRRRYEGLSELEPILDDLDRSLQELEDSITQVGPSPDPRTRSARGAELPHGQ